MDLQEHFTINIEWYYRFMSLEVPLDVILMQLIYAISSWASIQNHRYGSIWKLKVFRSNNWISTRQCKLKPTFSQSINIRYSIFIIDYIKHSPVAHCLLWHVDSSLLVCTGKLSLIGQLISIGKMFRCSFLEIQPWKCQLEITHFCLFWL